KLAFPEEDVDGVLERLAQRVSPRIVAADAQLDPVRRELDEYFAGRRRGFALALDWTLVGTFGRSVLGVTAEIPYGGVCRYAVVAHCASARSPSGIPSGVGTSGVSRRYHSASSAAWQPDPAAVIAWR